MQLSDLLEDDVMRKVKLFSSSAVKPCETIQDKINEWLYDEGNSITIFDIKQSVTVGSLGKDIIISIWYVEY